MPQVESRAFSELQRNSRSLRLIAIFAAIFTVLSAICVVWGVFEMRRWALPSSFDSSVIRANVQNAQNLLIIAFSFALLGLLASLAFELVRKRGEVLFEELSDEYQWHIQRNYMARSVDKEPGPIAKPELDIRISLRDFAKNADLLLVPGKFGPAIYALWNVALMVSAIVFSY